MILDYYQLLDPTVSPASMLHAILWAPTLSIMQWNERMQVLCLSTKSVLISTHRDLDLGSQLKKIL